MVSKGLVRDYDNQHKLDLFCSYSDYEIAIGSDFNYLKKLQDGMLFSVNMVLVDITQGWARPFDFIPIGHKTIARFQASEMDLALIRKEIPTIDLWEEADLEFELLKIE